MRNHLEGVAYLDRKITRNPFKHNNFDAAPYLPVNGHFDDSRSDLVDYRAWANTEDGKYWMFWDFEQRGAREGGARGTFDVKTQTWSKPNVTIAHHLLKDYRLIGGEPTQTKNFTLSDGKSHTFPFADRRMLEPKFYQDLEASTVAAFSTHGGSDPGDTVTLRRNLDVWFRIGNSASKYGTGQLRHLVFAGCGGMNCFTDHHESKTMFTDWLPAKYVNGLRTICGHDGPGTGAGDIGFRFFKFYNEGQAISDAWCFASASKADYNAPVTAAYGATFEEALTTLGDGRFTTEHAEPTYAAASVWKNL